MADKNTFDYFLEDAITKRGGTSPFFEKAGSKWGADEMNPDEVGDELEGTTPADDATADAEGATDPKGDIGYKATRKYSINSAANAEDAIVAAMTFLFGRYDLSGDNSSESATFVDRIFEVIDQGVESGLKQGRKGNDDVNEEAMSRKMKSIYTRLVYNFNKKKNSVQ